MTATLAELRASLAGLTLRDQHRLARRADQAASLREAGARSGAVTQLAAEVSAALDRVAERRASVPPVSYPAELPVSQRKDELAAAIAAHQVVIVAGETGSGKTTQLPKICLELGRGVAGQIGHTQPRRIAARTVAERIAAELGTPLGQAVGYKVRFADTGSDDALVKVMTDGILLTELRRDRQLLRYDTLIIDEAHERSLNIDFILGYLKQLLPRRPDLKVVVTSATIDPQRFSAHFSGAPVVEVSGRTYPVELRYRPLAPEAPDGQEAGQRAAEPRDQVQAITDAVAELTAEGPGDILVFLSGEREIRDTADALAGQAGLEVLPLYARLSAAEQYRVFQRHQGRRVVLATNVAETSLTVPGIRYVVDPGTARISRYSQRTKVQRLPIEGVSQASARQRAGRCGRTSDGICIRLYSEEDFEARPQFTDPEILRTNLASVILRMAALDLGAVDDFPFVDAPDARTVADGVRLLEELGAVAPARRGAGTAAALRLTATGRKLADLPVDPRLGRMILEAGRNGCAAEVLVITAALAIQDPRERPAEDREAADAAHRRFAEPGSDFLALLNLWDYLRERQRELSSSAFRRMCRREYLHYLRVREWQDVYGQLQQAAREVGVHAGQRGRDGQAGTATQPAKAGKGAKRERDPAEQQSRYPAELADRIHQSLLAGLLSHLGMQEIARAPDKGGQRRRGPAQFAGARGARFAIFPDSPQARKPPPWVMAAELVETSRLWARTVARVEPEWAEALAGDLVRRSYSEPRWEARRGAVLATEKVTLYGLPIVAARPVNYGRVDPAAARDLFIQHALVEGDWQTHHRFFERNQRARQEAAELEDRARRRGLVADDSVIFAFYDGKVPASVTSARHFDTWWKKARAEDPELLDLRPADLASPAAEGIAAGDYPASWGQLDVSYEFAPGEAADGVTVDVPLAVLFGSERDLAALQWQVPGMRHELVTELIRGLPKDLRRNFIPAPDTARAVLGRLGEPSGDLAAALARELTAMTGVPVPAAAFDFSRLPAHLRPRYQVTGRGRELAAGRDLAALRAQLRPQLQEVLAGAAAGLTRTGLRSWDFGTLPEVVTVPGPGAPVRGYPALADVGGAADIKVFDSQAEADASMRAGVRRLLLIAVPSGVRSIAGRLPLDKKMALSAHPYPSAAALLDDCAAAAASQVIDDAGGPVRDAEGFARLTQAARDGLAPATAKVLDVVPQVLAAAHEAELALAQAGGGPAVAPALADMRAQLRALVYPGFICAAGPARLPDLVRYLRAIVHRLGRLSGDQARDAERMAAVARVGQRYEQVLAGLTPSRRSAPAVGEVRWQIEELRVSLFAQVLGVRGPVSEKRVLSALATIGGS